jgi:hypothetical protein
MKKNIRKIADIRPNADESCKVKDGTIYRKGATVQVWWTQDALGRPFEGDAGRETWTLEDSPWGVTEAKRNYEAMKQE